MFFSYQNIFRQYPTNKKKSYDRFSTWGQGVGVTEGRGGGISSNPSKRHDLPVWNYIPIFPYKFGAISKVSSLIIELDSQKQNNAAVVFIKNHLRFLLFFLFFFLYKFQSFEVTNFERLKIIKKINFFFQIWKIRGKYSNLRCKGLHWIKNPWRNIRFFFLYFFQSWTFSL